MLGLAVSPDYRQAVAHTSNNQVIVLDIILGQHRVLKNPLDPPDDILGMIVNHGPMNNPRDTITKSTSSACYSALASKEKSLLKNLV